MSAETPKRPARGRLFPHLPADLIERIRVVSAFEGIRIGRFIQRAVERELEHVQREAEARLASATSEQQEEGVTP